MHLLIKTGVAVKDQETSTLISYYGEKTFSADLPTEMFFFTEVSL